MSEMGEHFRAHREAQQQSRRERALAAVPQELASLAWARAHGVVVRALECGWWYRRANRILCWWPSTGRVALSGRDAPPSAVRVVGRHDRVDIIARLAVAFPVVPR